MDEIYENKRLVGFKKECILAGPTQCVKAFLKKLMLLGVEVAKAESAKTLYSSNVKIVLLLQNIGVQKQFPSVTIINRTWWDYYHNPKKHKGNIIKTYNIPKQWKFVCNNILITENVPTLIPE